MQKLFKDQVRAILRAATNGTRIRAGPLVTRTEQLDFVLNTVGQAHEELEREGLEFDPLVPVGIMIEVAAAAAMVETWSDRVDYFALGTNDLTASALGLNRDDPLGARGSDPLHPGVLRLLHDVVSAARRAGRRVTVCGEMASDPEGTLALAALQVDALSVAVNQLTTVRQCLTGQAPHLLASLVPEMLRLETAAQVRELLSHDLRPVNSPTSR
jgi:phosphoenolpyruvate-protein kinase (PTS system EI component)